MSMFILPYMKWKINALVAKKKKKLPTYYSIKGLLGKKHPKPQVISLVVNILLAKKLQPQGLVCFLILYEQLTHSAQAHQQE